MIRVCRDRNNVEGEEFWTYVLMLTQMLGPQGMSDEEDADQPVTRGAVTIQEPVKAILDLEFRNPYFRRLFEVVDSTKILERMIFNRLGKEPMKRVRIELVSNRSPPNGLPKSFFNPRYLEKLMEHELDGLFGRDFELREFGDYRPNAQ